MRAFRLLLSSFSVLLLSLLTACGGGSSSSSPTAVAPPVISSFTTDKAAITAGQTAQLTPVFSGGTGSISNGPGSVQSNVAVVVAPTVTTTFVLTVTNAAGATDSKGVVVAVVAAPTIGSFTASPASITAGQSSVLTPNFTGGTGAVNQGIGAVTNGVPVVVTPAVTTTYVLTVTNSTGATTTAGALVTVVGSPTITSFTATPTQITAGQTSVLLAVFTGGTGIVTPTVGVVGSGSGVSVAPVVTTTYALTVTNSAGATALQTAIVNVVSGPFNISLSANPTLITVGDQSTLVPTFSGGVGTIDNGVGAVASGVPFKVTPPATTTYTLTVDNGAGVTDQRGVIVTVVAKPVIITFGNSPTTITAGATTTINAVYTGGTGVVTPNIGVIASGSAIQVSPSTTTTYTLTVTNAAGFSVFKTLTVIVLPPAGANSFTANPPVITLGGCSNLLAVFSGGSGNVNQGVGQVTSGVPVTVCPIVTTTYTLTVVNGAGGSSSLSATVTIVTAPLCSLVFNANPPGIGLNIPEGGSGNLVPTFPTGSGVINGVGNVLSGTPYPVNPVVNTTYTLTVTNAAGAVCTSSLTVTIIPNPRITSFIANPATITAGQASNLIGTFTGAGPLATDAIIRDQVPTTLFTGVQSGTANSVTPPVTTTYTLVIKNLLGVTANASITVTVIPAPVITVFEQCTAAGATLSVPITIGDTAYLHGSFINGTGQVDHGIGNFLSGLLAPTAVNPTQSTTYTLTVTNSAGSTALANATIVVLTGPNASAITANPIYVTNLGVGSSQTTFITPYFTVGTFGTASVTAKEAISNVVVPVPAALTTPLTGVPVGVNNLNVDTVFTLTVSNGAVPPVTTTQGVVVHVLPLPTAALTTNGTPASNPIITKGNSVGLLPTFTPTTGVTAIITPGVGAVATGGTYSVSPLVTTTYTLTVTNAAGYSVSSSVTVVVVDGPFAAAFYASPASIRVGQSTTFFAIFNPLPITGTATVTDLTPSGAPGFPYTPVSGLGVVKGPFAAAGVFQFRLHLDNGAGGIQDVYTTLTVAPALTAIALGTNVVGPPAHTITRGQTINLLPTWAPVGLGNGTIDNGVGAVVNGFSYTVAPQITTTYTLTVSDSAGVAGTVQRTVTVLDGPFASSVSANPLLITDGDTTFVTSVFNNPGPLGSASLANDAVANGGTTTPASPQVPVSGVATPYLVNFGGGPLATPKKVVFNLGVTNGATPVVTSNQSVVVTVYQAPVITSFTASAPSIGLGASSNLLPVFTGGAANIISGGGIYSIGNVTSGGAYTVSPAFTTAYTLTVTNPAGRQVVATTTVTVIQPPVIDSFTASPPTICAGGGGTNLYAVFHNAIPADGTINPGAITPVPIGTAIPVNPLVTTTYTLLVTNVNGSATATTTVVVVQPPTAVINGPSVAFQGQPNLVYTVAPQGPTAQYAWSVNNGAIITAGFGTNSITVTGGNATPMTVTCVVTNSPCAPVTGTKSVTLNPVVAPTASLVVTGGGPAYVQTGGTISLDAGWGGSVVSGVLNPGGIIVDVTTPPNPKAVIVGPVNANTVYTFTVTGPLGTTASAQIAIAVVAPPTISSFIISPATITAAGTAFATPVFSPVGILGSANTTITISNGWNADTGTPTTVIPAGSITSGVAIPVSANPGAAKTYIFTLQVTNAAGNSVSQSANLTVVPAPIINFFRAGPIGGPMNPADLTITLGQSAQLDANFINGTGAIAPTVGPVTAGPNYIVTPTVSTTYTLTVTNAAGDSVTRTRRIFVVSGPLNVSLSASAPIVTLGDPAFTLLPQFTIPAAGTAQVTVSLAAGGTGFPVTPTNGVPFNPLPTAAGTYTYTLTANNGAGTTATAGVTVTVVNAPLIASFLANGVNADLTINVGSTVTLQPNFSNGTGFITGFSPVTSGQNYTVTPTATTVYDLKVTNAAGTSITANRTVTVLSGQYSTSLTATPSVVTVNTGITNVIAVFSAPGGATVTLAGDANSGLASLTPVSGQSYPATPTTVGSHTYTLTITPAVGPVYTRAVTINVVAAPTAALALAGPGVITSGQSTVLVPTFTNGAGVLSTVGSVSTGQSYSVSPTSTTTFTLTVTNAAGDTATANQLVTVLQGIFGMSFDASPSVVTSGDPVTFGGQATIPGGGSLIVNPVFNAPFGVGSPFSLILGAPGVGVPLTFATSLTATQGGTGTTQTLIKNVTVYPVPVARINGVLSSTVTIAAGSTASITVNLSNGAGLLSGIGSVFNGDVITVSPATSTNYALTVTNGAGRVATANLSVIVIAAGAPSLIANKTVVTNGQSVLLTPSWTPNSATGAIAPAPGAVTNGVPVTVTPPSNATTTYVLTVTNGPNTSTAGVSVTAVPLPSALGLTAVPPSISAGGTSLLGVAYTGGVSATVNNGVGPVTNGGNYGVSPTTTTIYTLVVFNAAGDSATTTATVTVVQAPSITSFTASPTTITAGSGTSILTGIFSTGGPGGSAQINGSGGPYAATSGVGVPVTGLAAGSYTFQLDVSNSVPTTVSASVVVNVVDAPVATSLLANGAAADLTIAQGATATLQPNFSFGVGVVSPSVGSVVSGSNYAVTPAASTTYTLTVTNAAGATATQVRTITVVSGQLATSIMANPTTVTVSNPTDLTAIFNNGTATVSGVGPGGFTYGPTAYTSGASQSVPVGATPGTYTFTLTVTGTGAFTGITDSSKFASVTAVAAPAFTGGFAGLSINGVVGPVTVAAGSTITLVPSFTGGTGAINQGVGAVTSAQVYTTVANATTTYVLTVTNVAGDSITVARTANVLQGPFGLNLFVSPTVVTGGDIVVVSPTFTIPGGGTGVISGWFGSGAVPSGSVFNFPAPVVVAPTVLPVTLTVTQAGTGVTSVLTVYVTVYPVPAIASMLLNGVNGNITINSGSAVTVQPFFSNGTGDVNTIGSVINSLTYTVAPTATTSYVLTVTNPAGRTVAINRLVTVLAGPFAQSLSLSLAVATTGDLFTYTPVFTLPNPGTAVVTSPFFGAVNVLGGSGGAFGYFAAPGPFAGPVVVPFTLTVTSATGVVSTTTTSMIVYQAPTALLNGAAGSGILISAGQTTTLVVGFTNGAATLTGTGSVANGLNVLVTPAVTTNYVLTVTNPAGRVASAFRLVTVIPAPGTAALTVNRTLVTDGSTIVLMPSWNPNAGTGAIAPTVGGVTNGVPASLVPPAGATTVYTLTVTNGANTSTAGVSVTSVPPATGSLTGTATITAGQSTNLTVAITSAGTTGILRTFGSVVNGSVITVSPTTTTTYFLDLTNAAGDTVTFTATVTVLQGPLAISLAASPQLITLLDPFQMTAVFSGASGVVTSASGGDAAPGAMTSGLPVTVTPTSLGTKNYLLTVTSGAVTATTGTFVTVIAAPTVTTFSGASNNFGGPAIFQPGDTITWTILYNDGGTNTNGVFTDIFQGSSAPVNSTQSVVTTVPFVAPGTVLGYTLKVTNAAGKSVVATVNVTTS